MKRYLVVAWIPVPQYINDIGRQTGEWFEINANDIFRHNKHKDVEDAAIQYARKLQEMHPTIRVGVIVEEMERNTLSDDEVFGETWPQVKE